MNQARKVVISLSTRNKEVCDKIADLLTVEGVMHAEVVGSRSVTFVSVDQQKTLNQDHINGNLARIGVGVLVVSQDQQGVLHILAKLGMGNSIGVDLSDQAGKAKGLF